MNGTKLKIWLLENEITRSELAEKLGITERTLSTYCNNVGPKWLEFALGIKSIKGDRL